MLLEQWCKQDSWTMSLLLSPSSLFKLVCFFPVVSLYLKYIILMEVLNFVSTVENRSDAAKYTTLVEADA